MYWITKIINKVNELKFMSNIEAETGILKLIIGVFLVAVMAGALLPSGINSLVAGKNASGTWDAGTTSSFGAIQILIIVAVIAGIAGLAYKSME